MEIVYNIFIFIIILISANIYSRIILTPLIISITDTIFTVFICSICTLVLAISYSGSFIYYIYDPNNEVRDWLTLISLIFGLILILLNIFLVKDKKGGDK